LLLKIKDRNKTVKKNELTEIKGLEVEALKMKVKELKQLLAKNLIEKNMSTLKDKKTLIKIKKEVAQIMTIIRQKELLLEYEGIKKGEVV
jgi:ribosomal protein L29